MKEDRDLDKKHHIAPMKGTAQGATRYVQKTGLSLDVIKSKYIAEGKSIEEIAEEAYLPVQKIRDIIENNNLPELRKAYVIEGVQKIQNTQLQQSNKLLDLETNFKKMRIIQLEQILEDHLAYYSRHGDFYKRHAQTGEILKDLDGIPMQVRLPNISKEIRELKESVTMSEGVRQLLHRLDEIINTPKPAEAGEDPNTFDMSSINGMFKPSED